MKEFEKWLEEPTHRTPASYPRHATCDEDAAARGGWRAAFKCILDKCHHYQSQDVIDFILKELEEN